MRLTIHLDDQPDLDTGKIRDEPSNRMLAPELESFKASSADCRPQLSLGD